MCQGPAKFIKEVTTAVRIVTLHRMWWPRPVTPVLGRLRQEECYRDAR